MLRILRVSALVQIMRIRCITFMLLIALLGTVTVLPWIEAYRRDPMTHFQYGEVSGKYIECMAVGGKHFDRFACLVYSGDNSARVGYRRGRILLDGRPVDFPKGCNVGWLLADDRIEFQTMAQEDIETGTFGPNRIYYILGKPQMLKKWRFGKPRIELVERKAESL